MRPAMTDTEDPHAVMHIYEGDGGVIIRENGNVSSFGVQSVEVRAAFAAATAAVPADIAALVERLEHRAVSEDGAVALIDDDLAEAASLIQSQAAESAADKARIAELEKKLADERHRATNAEHFNVAYRNMLGPVGVKVAELWREKNVRRIHFDWGPEAVNLTGEERAQIILDMENMPSREVDDIDNDGKGPRTSAARRALTGGQEDG